MTNERTVNTNMHTGLRIQAAEVLCFFRQLFPRKVRQGCVRVQTVGLELIEFEYQVCERRLWIRVKKVSADNHAKKVGIRISQTKDAQKSQTAGSQLR